MISHYENCGIHHTWCPDPKVCYLEHKVSKLEKEDEELKSQLEFLLQEESQDEFIKAWEEWKKERE